MFFCRLHVFLYLGAHTVNTLSPIENTSEKVMVYNIHNRNNMKHSSVKTQSHNTEMTTEADGTPTHGFVPTQRFC